MVPWVRGRAWWPPSPWVPVLPAAAGSGAEPEQETEPAVVWVDGPLVVVGTWLERAVMEQSPAQQVVALVM